MEPNDKKRWISPGSAGIILICFFLPWVKFSCAGTSRTSSGADLGGSFWIVFALAFISLVAFFYFRSIHKIKKSKPIFIGSSVIILIFLIYKYLEILSGIDTGYGKITASEIGLTIHIGGVLSVLGAISAWVGTRYISSEELEPESLKIESESSILPEKIVCPHCSCEISLSHKFCPDCGGEIVAEEVAEVMITESADEIDNK